MLQCRKLSKRVRAFRLAFFQRLTRSQRTSLDKLKQHGAFLAETNERLVQEVQQAEDSAVKQVRELLQQYEVFGVRLAGARRGPLSSPNPCPRKSKLLHDP